MRETVQTNVVRLEREPPYVKMYLDDVTAIMKMQPQISPVLYEVLKLMNFEGFIVITKSQRVRIAEALNINEKTVKNRLTELVKKGVMRRTARCEYEMNPALFAKGDWSNIQKRRDKFKLTVTYNQDGTRFVEGKII